MYNNADNVLVLSKDINGRALFGYVPGLPSSFATTPSLYAIGCTLTDTVGGSMYTMNGTVLLPTWENSDEIKTIDVTITYANILAMFGAPVTVIPAPGAGKIIKVLSATLNYDRDTATYGGGGTVALQYTGGAPVTTAIAAAVAFGSGADIISTMLPAAGAALANTAVEITNAAGAFTDPGTAVGTAKLKVSYTIETL